MNYNKKIGKILFVIVFLIAIPIFLRLYYLRADLPSDYKVGTQNCDEVPWMHNARNKALFGNWIMENDEWNPIFVSPLFSFVTYPFLRFFGPSVSSGRLTSVLFSLLGIVLFYIILKNEFNRKIALLGTFLLSYNFVYLIFSRAVMLDMFSTFFVILSFYFFHKSIKNNFYLLFVGISSFLAFLTKASNIHFFLTIFFSTAFILYKSFKERKYKYIIKSYLYLITGWLIILLTYMYFVFIPYYNQLMNMYVKNFFIGYPHLSAFITSFNLRIFKIITLGFEKAIFIRMPIVSLTGFLFFIILVRRLLHKYEDVKPVNFFALSWIFFTFLFFFIAEDNTPLRRMIPMIPAIVFLSAQLISNFKFGLPQSELKNKKSKVIMLVLYFTFVYNIITNIFKYVVFRYSDFMLKETTNFFLKFKLPLFSFNAVINFLSILYSIFITIIIFILYFKYKNKFKKAFCNIISFINKRSKIIVTIMLILVFLICLFQFYDLVVKADDSYYRASISLGDYINNVKIQGFVSSCFMGENENIPIYVVPPYTNWDDKWNRTDVKYFMLVIDRDYGVDTKKARRDLWLGHYTNATLIWSYNLTDREQSEVGLFAKNEEHKNSTERAGTIRVFKDTGEKNDSISPSLISRCGYLSTILHIPQIC